MHRTMHDLTPVPEPSRVRCLYYMPIHAYTYMQCMCLCFSYFEVQSRNAYGRLYLAIIVMNLCSLLPLSWGVNFTNTYVHALYVTLNLETPHAEARCQHH